MEMETPYIRCWARSQSGLRVYFASTSLVGQRFRFALEGNNLLLDQVPEDDRTGNLVRESTSVNTSEWRTYALCGARMLQPVKIMPEGGQGRLAYVIPDIPDLHMRTRSEALREMPMSPQRLVGPSGSRHAPPLYVPASSPPVVPSPESLGLVGKNGSGQLASMHDYMCNVITAIDKMEGTSPYRLVKGGNGWAWRAPDIRPKE
jgi:hypothetical protein